MPTQTDSEMAASELWFCSSRGWDEYYFYIKGLGGTSVWAVCKITEKNAFGFPFLFSHKDEN